MKIKENYVPRAAAKVANRNAGQMAVCPNCKQQIPVNELDEHMKSTRTLPALNSPLDLSPYPTLPFPPLTRGLLLGMHKS